MRLLSLTVNNLGVFRGEHRFDLSPVRQPDAGARNLIVVSGENGAGKSTLFRALGLALHGSLALGERVSRQAYGDFLSNRLHRPGGTASTSDEGSVTLGFRYVRSGQPLEIEVQRSWRRSGGNVSESLVVMSNGESPEVNAHDYQTWLNDLIPSGLAPLCFFDAEQLAALAAPEQALLGETLRRLLGLDLAERLQTDLARYTSRQGGSRKTEYLREEALEQQACLESLDAQLNRLRLKEDALNDEQAGLESALEQQERRLAAEGGTYAARRPLLQERLAVVQADIETVAEQLRELSVGLLPFALVPRLCATLARKLTQEVKLRRREIIDEFWQGQVYDLETALLGEELWQGLELSPDDRRSVARRMIRLLRDTNSSATLDGQGLVHHLAEPEHDRLQGWIAQALHSVPRHVESSAERLRELQTERHRIEEDLRRAPEDEALAPIHATIERLQTSLVQTRQRQTALSEELGALRFRREEQERQLRRAAEQLQEAQASERQSVLAKRSKLVLRTYQDALTRQRLAALEEALVESFNTVCHKDHLLAAASIEPGSFEVRLQSVNGHALSLDELSAGERHLYALALLWALRRVSGRQLPLAVDTPLARLDEVHRERFVHRYVPAASDQVILFVTDAEMDAGMLAQAEPARVYRLTYDSRRGETQVAAAGVEL